MKLIPATTISHYKGQTQFYPVIKFYSPTLSDNFFLNEPQPTRAKALTIARQYTRTHRDTIHSFFTTTKP